mgnify:CR=1 FL=1
MRITLISDTHTKHKVLTSFLPGGDLLIHAGDFTSVGHSHEVQNFCKWFNSVENYDNKIFIPGNHDLSFEGHYLPDVMKIVNSYEWINLLIDQNITLNYLEKDGQINIYGSPWQPEFCNWAFNLPRNGVELEAKWAAIPDNTDILITHGPPHGIGDVIIGGIDHLGCELLAERISIIKPKIHIFGHIHSGHGYIFDGDTHFFNASTLDERYIYKYKPITFDWDPETNEIEFI